MDFRYSEEKYKESLNWLYSQLPMFSRVGAAAYKPGLETTESLDQLFGHPHKKFKSIHVAGTNGKGSTSHMIASVLQAQGYKTGLYTSPHLTDFRERMRINGNMIPKESVIRFVQEWKKMNSDKRPSFFELTMMMAFDWFAEEKVDIAVVEVGMGGRLDSTNIITPVLSIITNIDFDHTQFLGDTLPAIAAEKAGIIKKGVPVVIGECGEVGHVFADKASSVAAPLIKAEEQNFIKDFKLSAGGWRVELRDGTDLYVPLGGEYQKRNITTVISSVMALRLQGWKIADSSIKEGLNKVPELTGLRGRWQIIEEKPLVVCDTGHNVAGITLSLQTLKARYPKAHKRFVIGFVNDKDVDHIVNLFPKEASYYFTNASIPRAMPALDVADKFRRFGIEGSVFNSVEEAVSRAKLESSPQDVIYIGGSTFIVADFLATLKK